MKSLARPWLAPGFIFVSLLLGGSSLGIWFNAALQLAAIALLLAAWQIPRRKGSVLPRPLIWLVSALVALILLQLVPLPPQVWHLLPGRQIIIEGDALLGLNAPWRPLSLSPPDGVGALLTLLVPIASIVTVTRLGGNSGRRIAIAVAAGAILNLVLGVLQVGAGADGARLYLQARANVGIATGFFANGNHLAALLLCVLPLVAGAVEQTSTESRDRQRRWTAIGAFVGMTIMVVSGLLLTGSLFGLAMVAPVTIASVLVAFRHSIGRRGRLILAGTSAFVMIGGLVLAGGDVGSTHAADASTSLATRVAIAETSASAAARFFPAGSGAGTFEKVYPLFEGPQSVDRFFVNHAHNDYLEWAVEGGLPGLVILGLFLGWWALRMASMLRDHRATGYAQAGAIVGVILLVHSLVDFPLRTPALAAIFGAATGLMLMSRRLPKQRPDLRPVRHITIP